MSSATLTELEARYQFACEVARAAGSRAMSWYQQRNQLIAEYKKDLQDLVSEADRNVEELIRHLILERFPEDAVIGEESGGDAGQARFIWVVDPIDGTSNFLSGLHNWCVALAIVCEGEPVIGWYAIPIIMRSFTPAGAKAHG